MCRWDWCTPANHEMVGILRSMYGWWEERGGRVAAGGTLHPQTAACSAGLFNVSKQPEGTPSASNAACGGVSVSVCARQKSCGKDFMPVQSIFEGFW